MALPTPAALPQFQATLGTQSPPQAVASIRALVVMGFAPLGTANVPTFHTNPSTVLAQHGVSAAVDCAMSALSYGDVAELIFVPAEANTNIGAYGPITGTFADPEPPTVTANAALPTDDAEIRIRFTQAGRIEPDSTIRYRLSTDNGRTERAEERLLSATTIGFPGGGGVDLSIDNNALITIAAGSVFAFEAHALETPAHGIADPSAPYGITSPVDVPTSITAAGELLTAALNHVNAVAGVHNAADATAFAALSALTAPTNPAEAVDFYNAFKAIHNTHANDTPTVHFVASTNTIGAPDATQANVLVGDEIVVLMAGPYSDATELAAAMDGLRTQNKRPYGHALHVGQIEGTFIGTIKDELTKIQQDGVFTSWSFAYRMPSLDIATGATETATAYDSAFDTSFAAFNNNLQRTYMGAVSQESALYRTADGQAQMRRSFSWPVAWRVATTEPEQSQQEVGIGAFARCRLADANGATYPGMLDEQAQPYSVVNRAVGPRTIPQKQIGAVYVTQDLAFKEPNEPWTLGPYVDVALFLITVVQPALVDQIGSFLPAVPGEPLSGDIKKQLEDTATTLARRNAEGRIARLESTSAAVEVVIDPASNTNGQLLYDLNFIPGSYAINGVELTANLVLSLTGDGTLAFA